jgi:hypothetical protein
MIHVEWDFMGGDLGELSADASTRGHQSTADKLPPTR